MTSDGWSARSIIITRLLETPAAQDYLRSHGITAPEFVTSFRVGYVDAGSAGILPAGVSAAHAVRADALNAGRMPALPGNALPALQLETNADGSMLFTIDEREYRIRGLSPVGLERLRVNLR